MAAKQKRKPKPAAAQQPKPKKRRNAGGKPAGQGKGKAPCPVPLAAVPDEEVEEDATAVDQEDVAFVAEYGEHLGFLDALDTKELDKSVSAAARKAKPAGKLAAEGDGEDTDDDISDGSEADMQGKPAANDRHGGGQLAGSRRRASEGAATDSEDEEAQYERVPRAQRDEDEEEKGQRRLLPIKTQDGGLVYEARAETKSSAAMMAVEGVVVEDDMDAAADDDGSQPGPEGKRQRRRKAKAAMKRREADGEAGQGDGAAEEDGGDDGAAPRSELSDALQALEEEQSSLVRREQLKVQMAKAAQQLLQEPAKQLPELRGLLELAQDRDAVVARLAMLSLAAVFKDIAPSYRIRQLTKKELQMPVSKEIKQLRDWESGLLRGYQQYLLLLKRVATSHPRPPLKSLRIAVRCFSELAVALPHFNFSSELLQQVVPRMADPDAETRRIASDAIRALLSSDPTGKVALEAVQLVADLVKQRRCRLPADALRECFVLDFQDAQPEDLEKGTGWLKRKLKKKKKQAKEDDVDAAFREAEAEVDREERRLAQSQSLEALFEMLFRILKQAATAGPPAGGKENAEERARVRFPLLEPALEGLAQYAHFISVEYFADLAQVLKQLLTSPSLPLATRLRCVLTISDILQGQGEALNIDRRDFIAHLYAVMLQTVLQPLQEAAEALHDHASTNGSEAGGRLGSCGEATSCSSSDAALMVRVVNRVVLETKSTDASQMAAFARRLAGLALHLDTGTAMGCLAVLYRLLRRHRRLRSMLDGEGLGPQPGSGIGASGIFSNLVTDPAEAGALNSTMWELALLSLHYHPHTAQAAAATAELSLDSHGSTGSDPAVAGVLATAHGSPEEVLRSYDTSRGTFRPPPPARKLPRASTGRDAMLCRRAYSLTVAEPTLREMAADDASESDVTRATGEPASSVTAEDDGLNLQAVEAGFRSHFREARLFRENVQLRGESAALERKLQLFQDHLAESSSRRAPADNNRQIARRPRRTC